jgi:hypothetical protein
MTKSRVITRRSGSNPVPVTKQFNGLPSGEPFVFDVRENNPKVTDSNLSPQLRGHAAVQFADSKRRTVTLAAARQFYEKSADQPVAAKTDSRPAPAGPNAQVSVIETPIRFCRLTSFGLLSRLVRPPSRHAICVGSILMRVVKPQTVRGPENGQSPAGS